MLATIANGYSGALDYTGRLGRRPFAIFVASLAAVGGLLYATITALYRLPDEAGVTLFYPALDATGPAIKSTFLYAATDASGDPAGSYGPAVLISMVAALWIVLAIPTLHAAFGRRLVDAGGSPLLAFLPFAPVAGGLLLALGRVVAGVVAQWLLDAVEGRGPIADPARTLAGSFELLPTLLSFMPAIGLVTALTLVPLALLVALPSRGR